MATRGYNLATHTDAERQSVYADLHAWRIIHQKGKRPDWRQWAKDELSRIPLQLRDQVKAKLNSFLGSK